MRTVDELKNELREVNTDCEITLSMWKKANARRTALFEELTHALKQQSYLYSVDADPKE